MKGKLISVILSFLSLASAAAQDYIVELKPDIKVINVGNLGLPDNTPVLEVLRLLPELVVREGNSFLSGYDLLLDSKSLGNNREVLLATIKLCEIEKIEISTSATASQQVNGMAGTIKLVSRTMPEGFSGTVTAAANTLWDVYPNMILNYRTDKLELRGNLGLQYYDGQTSSYFERGKGFNKDIGENTVTDRYFQETARFHLKYTPTERDQFKFWLMESMGRDNVANTVDGIHYLNMSDLGMNVFTIKEDRTLEKSILSDINFSAYAQYEHTFRNRIKFSASADYLMSSNREGVETLVGVAPRKPQTIKSEAKFVIPFLPEGNKSLNMTLGGNVEYDIRDRGRTDNRSLITSPLLDLKFTSPRWKIFAGVRYHHYDRYYAKSEQGLFSNGSDDITFNFNTLWQIVDHHALRFLVTKNSIRPTTEQLYPGMEFDGKRGIYVCGNSNLGISSMYSFELDYITDWNSGPHNFVANVSFGYDRADALVNTTQKYDEERRIFYQTMINSGLDNIFKAKGNLIYKYGIFSVSLAGNWYHNIKKANDIVDNIDSFNIGLSPVFSFRNDWTLSGTFTYNNAVVSNFSRIGECLYSYLRISKTFGKWIVSAALNDIFGYTSENYEYRQGGYQYTMYDQYPRCFEIGVTYRIGR